MKKKVDLILLRMVEASPIPSQSCALTKKEF